MAPWAKTGGLGDVTAGLPAALAALGHEVTVVLPKYRGIVPREATVSSATVALGRLREQVEFHLIQIASLWFIYRGALEVRDVA